MGIFHNGRRAWVSRAGVLLAVVVVGGALIVRAEPVTVPHTFSAGTKISSSEMNADFAAMKDGIERNRSRIVCVNKTGADATLGSAFIDIASVTLAAPGPGTVMVTGTGTITAQHDSKTSDGVTLNLSNVSAQGSPFQLEWIDVPNSGGGGLQVPFAIQGYWDVAQAGSSTYYLTGRRQFNTEQITVRFATLCAVFAPN